jgi:hypothetical protein
MSLENGLVTCLAALSQKDFRKKKLRNTVADVCIDKDHWQLLHKSDT